MKYLIIRFTYKRCTHTVRKENLLQLLKAFFDRPSSEVSSHLSTKRNKMDICCIIVDENVNSILFFQKPSRLRSETMQQHATLFYITNYFRAVRDQPLEDT